MRAFISFLAGVLVGVAGHWFFTQPQPKAALNNAKDEVREGATNLGRSLQDTFSAENVKDELARTGKVIREKTRKAGDAIADATANVRITAAIKAKLVQDAGLSAFKIDVDTTDGVVTLSGTVSSHEEIAKAMTHAWETDGVTKVISTLQVKPK
jgi:hyperosmotically inducible periplasmic protein